MRTHCANSSLLILALALPLAGMAEAQSENEYAPGLEELTPEQLENYQFEGDAEANDAVVGDLSVGQRAILSSQRREARDLLARELGILSFEGRKKDLATLQRIYDREVLRDDQVREWQNVGVLFGDILVNEFSLHWVSYEDDRGLSKALQLRDTRNFVFPITVFSKRIQFGEEIDVQATYEQIASDVREMMEYEARLGDQAK